MTETAETAYDPIPKLAMLLGAAQRLADGIDATAGVTTFARQLTEGLRLPEFAYAEEIEAALRKALALPGIREGVKVRVIDPPGTKVPFGAVGVAEEAPGAGSLFWARFGEVRMHTRVSEVEIVTEGDPS